MESLRFVLQSVKKVSDNIGGLHALPKKIKKPIQEREREVFIVGRAAFLSLFCFFFLLIFYYYAKLL